MFRTTIAASVLALVLAACGGGGDTADGGADGALTAEGGAVTIQGLDTLKYSATEIIAQPGTLEVTLECEPAVNHDFVIEELGDEVVVECAAGETATGTTSELEPGTYTYYCSVPGHRAAGMEGTLTVEG
jgi:plastocyanin